MHRSIVISTILAFAALVAAQNQTIQLVVGGEASTQGGIFQFIPPSITASEGSVVTFQFAGNPGNHSITQSSFSSPCQPLTGGFDSGFVFIPQGTETFPTFELTITNGSQPIWFYCKQLSPAPHCQAGMVGAINAPTSGNTFDLFQQAATHSTGTPGQNVGGLVGVGASASAPPGPLTGSGVEGFGNPTGASAASVASATSSASTTPSSPVSSPSTSPSTSSSGMVEANGLVMMLAALLGVTLA
ncbi:hypothetical protein BV25DRAFT_1619270 [Artomyces pyxidatus]|uniref:Uncharacterized protein n=1 Tax=Artomyces pyxidatus TaxID=48021 RepID=A0ACB8TCI8_9AGAM|nr:hypothetical protein BV25DRAFT_1619270 [Artomyces pyxidatus]